MNKIIFALLAAFITPVFAGTVCYGERAGADCTAPDLLVDAGDVLTLPGNVSIEADQDRVATSIILTGTKFVGIPTVTTFEGNVVSVLTSTDVAFAVAGEPPYVISGLQVWGVPFNGGDDVVIRVRAWNPNGAATTLFDGDIVAAQIRGVTETFIALLNPASNTTQQTFLRVVNRSPGEAMVTLRATDDSGNKARSVLILGPNQAVQLTSQDLEAGNPEKGLIDGWGNGIGKWSVEASANVRVSITAQARGGLGSL